MPRQKIIPYAKQFIDDADLASVASVLKSDFLTTGPVVDEFERELGEYLGTPYVVACSSGTAALHLCCIALGLTGNDTVIVPAITFVATANAPRLLGANIVFADVDPESGLLTPETLDEAIDRSGTNNVAVVFAVHLAGNVCDLKGLNDVINRRIPGAKLIEDACHAFGGNESESDNKKTGVCTYSYATVFSLHPAKTITTGEGGLICTTDQNLADNIVRLRNHGMIRKSDLHQRKEMSVDPVTQNLNPWYYEIPDPGYNYRITDIQCALGLSQLRKVDQFISYRASVVDLYDEQIAEHLLGYVLPMAGNRNIGASWHLYAARFDFSIFKSRNWLVDQLNTAGILTQVHYFPVNEQPYYKSLNPDLKLDGANHYYSRTLSLPLHMHVSYEDVRYIVESIRDCMKTSA